MTLIKKFFRLSFIFIAIYLTLVLLTSYINYNKFTNRIDNNTKYLFLGHSHTEVAYNDEIIKYSLNLAQSGESYFYTYYKLKAILSKSNNISYIFLEYSNNMFGKEMDSAIFDDIHLKENLPKYLYFFDTEALKYFVKINLVGFYNSLKLVLLKNIKFSIFVNNLTFSHYTGCYLPLDSSRKAIIHNKKNIHYSGSKYNIKYLNKILDLCKTNNKKIILIRTPLSNNYNGFSNENDLRQFMKKNNFIFWDYSRFFNDDKYFYDASHLNIKGSIIYSNYINNKLNQ